MSHCAFHISSSRAGARADKRLVTFSRISPYPQGTAQDASYDDSHIQFFTSGSRRLCKNDESTTVYQALAVIKNGAQSVRFVFEPPGILYKVASGKEATTKLRTEARLYCEQLKTLQGEFVPIFRGYFQRKLIDGTETECIVVSSSGKTGSGQLRMPKADHLVWAPIKQAWVNALIEIHKAGVQYGDNLLKMMITKDQDNPEIMRIADFKTATTGHVNCKGLGPASSSYEAHTNLAWVDEDDCCPELLRFCQIINFLGAAFVYLANIVYGNDVLPVDPEFNVSKLVQHARSWLVPNEHWPEAFQCYIDYTKAWGPEKRHQELLEERAEWEKQKKNAPRAIGDDQVERTEQ